MTRQEMRAILEPFGLTLQTWRNSKQGYEIRRSRRGYPLGRLIFRGSRLEAIAWVKQILSWKATPDEVQAWLNALPDIRYSDEKEQRRWT